MKESIRGKIPFYEFFAGGGLARLGLGDRWTCLFANDIDCKKADSYRANFGPSDELVVGDVANISTDMLPKQAVLAWASFPCQDLSLAGNGEGINAARSGAFWPFWRLMISLKETGHAVPIIAIENVVGLISSNKGQDFKRLCTALSDAKYRFGALVINANRFVPQSRPRVFIIAIQKGFIIPKDIISPKYSATWHPESLVQAVNMLPEDLRKNWLWWRLPEPVHHDIKLIDVIEENPHDVSWHSTQETQKLINMMTQRNLSKIENAARSGELTVGALYKRTRNGVQRAEVRFDGTAGCLRTPTGGSSRQTLVLVEGNKIQTRLLSTREAARIMGLQDSYVLPDKYNVGYHLLGDAVSVPVVSHLERFILYPLAVSLSSNLKTNIDVSRIGGRNVCRKKRETKNTGEVVGYAVQ